MDTVGYIFKIVESIKGKITADVIEARFAYAGKVAGVNKKPGDTVKIGDLLATLDRKQQQTVLDKELADYEKVRAEFEIFALNNPNPDDDLTKYKKTEVQATLNASVKAVELAKFSLDEADLKSPVNGIVIDNNGMRSGMYITPGSYAFKIIDTDTICAETKALIPAGTKVKIKHGDTETEGTVLPLIPSLKGKPAVRIKPENTDGLGIGEEYVIIGR
jgi:multidrug resistance efflux pump